MKAALFVMLLCSCSVDNSTPLVQQTVNHSSKIIELPEPADPLPPTLLPTPKPWWVPITVTRAHHHAMVASVASVSYKGPFHGIEFTMSMNPIAYGADAYTTIYVNNVAWAQVGINGFDHWQRDPCNNPVSQDRRFFIGLAADNRKSLINVDNTATWSNDVAVDYPSPHPYDALITFKVTSDNGHIRFYVEGEEIAYRDVGNFAPEGGFDNVAAFIPTANNDVKVELLVLSDGEQDIPCGSVEVPFIPGTGPVDVGVTWTIIKVF